MGCSTEKFLKEGTNLLYENRLYIDGEEKRNAAVKELISPKPNTYFLGIPLKLQLNQLSKELPKEYFEKWLNKKSNRKEKLNSLLSPKQVYQLEKYFVRLNTWMKNNGEEPRIVDSLLIKKNISRLNQFYKNLGYFDVETNFEITELKPKNQEIKYKVNLKEVYIIEDYVEEIKSNELKDMFLFNIDQSFIKSGSSFSIERIEKERDRLIKLFRNNGVYNFQQNSVQFLAKIDSSGIDKRINVVLEINSIQKRINDTLKTIPYKKFKIDEINIFIESLANNDLNYNYKSYYKGFIINSKEKLKYRNKAITDPIFIKKGELYSDNDRTSTYGYFNSLGNFKYPSITYEPNSDSTLIASVFLISKERFSLGMDLDISHSNIQDVGMGLGITNGIRNLFKGTEILDFRIKSTLGASRNSAVASDRFFNLFELGADIKIKFPKIVSPLPISLEKFIPREMDPITQLTFGTTLQENIGLDKQYFGSSFEYQWSPKKSRKISFKLIDLEFVNNKNVENYFNVYRNSYDRLNTIAKNNSNTSQFMGSDGNLAIPEGSNSFIENVQNGNLQLETQAELDRVSSISERQQRLTVNNLILGSSLSFNTNSQKSLIDENFYQLKWKIEWVGNVLNKLLEFSSEKNNKGEYAINGVSPSQYIKTELDYVKHYQTGRDRILAFRFFGGIALPTGSSLSIPFSRSYFAGGANDNRAWKAYKLGPGTGSNNNEFNEANLKISTNLEYRFPLIGPLKGALFIDAGNIWNIADNIKDSDASFEKISDLSEIAVGSGFGIRYDLDFFVFRFDTAFKTYNPSLEKQNRWLSEFSLKQAVFNIGINYPF
jgi:outer membrane protein assembly factor BamA